MSGLQTSAIAKLAIDDTRRNLARAISDKDKKKLRKVFDSLKEKWREEGVLAAAEFVLDSSNYTFLDTCRDVIDRAIDHEKKPERLATWADSEDRRKVLITLKKRLQGKI